MFFDRWCSISLGYHCFIILNYNLIFMTKKTKQNLHNFVIYKFKLFECQQRNMYLSKGNSDKVLEDAQKHLGSFFEGNKITISFNSSNENNDHTLYPNDIIANREKVILLRINNVIQKSLVREDNTSRGRIPNYNEVKENSYPYSYVIIDNRDGIGQIAIERSSAWGSNTDKVRDILQQSLHAKLADTYGLDISIDAKMSSTKFWDFIHYRLKKENDQITKIQFSFPNKKKVLPIDTPTIKNENIRAMMNIAEISGAIKSAFQMEFDSEGNDKINEKNQDLAEMVNICANNAYELSVYFKDFKVYRCNENVFADYALDHATLNSFQIGDRIFSETKDEGEFMLLQWLDNIRKETHDYDTAKQTFKRKNARAS